MFGMGIIFFIAEAVSDDPGIQAKIDRDLIANFNASVSSVSPSPSAPYVFTFRVLLNALEMNSVTRKIEKTDRVIFIYYFPHVEGYTYTIIILKTLSRRIL
jgi:hypothetical protein